jgi:hypothetical protein
MFRILIRKLLFFIYISRNSITIHSPSFIVSNDLDYLILTLIQKFSINLHCRLSFLLLWNVVSFFPATFWRGILILITYLFWKFVIITYGLDSWTCCWGFFGQTELHAGCPSASELHWRLCWAHRDWSRKTLVTPALPRSGGALRSAPGSLKPVVVSVSLQNRMGHPEESSDWLDQIGDFPIDTEHYSVGRSHKSDW